MATTAEPATDDRKANDRTDHRQRLGHRRAGPAASPDGVRAPRASPERRRDQDHLRRHLPFRPAHRAQRLGRHASIPIIPGHEIVGTVTAVGNEVTRHRVGDTVAVGCMVDSCMECDQCLAGWEVFCRKGCVQTYNSADYHDGTITKGGYTDHIVVRDHFVLKVPEGMDVSHVAPLLCAGITTYSPLRQYNVGPGHEDGGRRPRRPRPHGREARRRARRARHHDHDHAEQGPGRPRARRHDVIISTDAGADGSGGDPLRLHPQYHPRQPRDRRLSAAARPLRADGHRRRADADAGLCRHEPHLVESRGRRIGDRRHSRRHRRCSTSAPPRASIRTSSSSR